MREQRAPLRGEAGRVAARVRELIGAEHPVVASVADPLDPESGRAGGSWRERLAAVVPVRIDPGRRATLAMAAAVIVAAVITAAWVMSSRPRPVALSAAPTHTALASSATGAAALPGTVPLSPTTVASETAPVATPSAASGDVVVDVAGRVRRPGLYHLPAGSRIDDALTAAGGARRGVDLTALNLAALLADGQQIVVGPHAQVVGAAPATPPGDGESDVSTAPVSLNTATLEQLETLPRIGPVTAQKILDYRAAHGNFTAIDQLKDVSGIGDVTFAGLAPLVTL